MEYKIYKNAEKILVTSQSLRTIVQKLVKTKLDNLASSQPK